MPVPGDFSPCALKSPRGGGAHSFTRPTTHAMSSPTQLLFPSTDPDNASISPPVSPHPLVTPHLPFRRMSLPVAPNLNLNRQSVASLASFESLSENGTSQNSPTKMLRSRRISIENHRRGVRRRGYQAPDKERDTRRRKVIQEFYETERTYVQGLDLIYEVGRSSVNTHMTVFTNYGSVDSYFLRPLSLHLIHHILSSIAQISHPCSPTLLTFGTFIARSFLLSTNTFTPPLPPSHPHTCPQFYRHIYPLSSCHIFRICLCIHHLLPRSAHPWLL